MDLFFCCGGFLALLCAWLRRKRRCRETVQTQTGASDAEKTETPIRRLNVSQVNAHIVIFLYCIRWVLKGYCTSSLLQSVICCWIIVAFSTRSHIIPPSPLQIGGYIEFEMLFSFLPDRQVNCEICYN